MGNTTDRVLDQKEKDARVSFIDILMANVDNTDLDDYEFRQFARCSVTLFTPTARVEELRKKQNEENEI